MKKQIITASLISAAILTGSFATVAIKNANASQTEKSAPVLAVAESPLAPASPITITPKYETVYAIINNDGAINQSFINSTINNSKEPLPVNLTINYYLDGVKTTAADLAGKSGHVRVSFHYDATKTYQEKYIPFVAITGLILDDTKFSNITLENGKIISEDRGIAIVGYAIAGINENLGTDFLPNKFAFEADVKDFALDTTYTIATNSIFSSIDTSKLTSIDSVINSVNDLAGGLNQIVNGATDLSNGLGQLSTGINTLQTNVTTIVNKVISIANDAESVLGSFNELVDAGRAVIQEIPTTSEFLNDDIDEFASEHELSAELTDEIKSLIAAKYAEAYTDFSTKVNHIDSTITTATDTVASYITKIKSGATELKNGVDAIASGADQLYNGSISLKNGLHTFKSQGIDRLVSFANNDLDNFIRNLRKTIEAASSYHNYNSDSAQSVKFVFKTPSIK